MITITGPRIFSLDEANELLPIILRITKESSSQVAALVNDISVAKKAGVDISYLETRIDDAVNCWQRKMKSLGATPKGLWLLDFDNGKGYYCWRYPENKITTQHDYNEGLSGRRGV